MPRPSWLLLLLLLLLVLLPVNSGRRYTLREGSIVESKPFADEHEWLEEQVKVDIHDVLLMNDPRYADALLIADLLQQQRQLEHWDWADLRIPGHEIRHFSLAAFGRLTLFVLTRNGQILEKFNAAPWTSINHCGPHERVFQSIGASTPASFGPADVMEHPTQPQLAPFVSLTSTDPYGIAELYDERGYDGMLACDVLGRVLQRQPTEAGGLLWLDVSLPQQVISSGGVAGYSRLGVQHVFFVTQSGQLVGRNLRASSWTTFGNHSSETLSLVVDVFAIKTASVFCISKSGQLLEFVVRSRKWTHHASPTGTTLRQEPAANMLNPQLPNSLFCTTTSGRLAQFYYQHSRWTWRLLSGDGGDAVASALAGNSNDRVWAITSEHKLLVLSVAYFAENASWVDLYHYSPAPSNQKLVLARPAVLQMNDTEKNLVMAKMENGNLFVVFEDYADDGYQVWENGVP